MKKRLPNKEFRKLVPKLREKGFYNSKEKRPINWKKYNSAQTEEALELLKRINEIVDSCKIKKVSNLGRKGIDEKILAKVILLCETLQLT
ncbi:hypothetical protein COU56_04795, partial [Candidatus Pacearchaeota archaeon CG10_big_fil_rev_8_21_14_0_10_31_9]